jgi:hypothetical protein
MTGPPAREEKRPLSRFMLGAMAVCVPEDAPRTPPIITAVTGDAGRRSFRTVLRRAWRHFWAPFETSIANNGDDHWNW